MWCKVLSGLFVLVAIAMGILACKLPTTQIAGLLLAAKFFDVMLPILGVGALVKYLFSGCQCNCKLCKGKSCETTSCETK